MFTAALPQQPKGGSNPDVHQLMTGLTKCGTSPMKRDAALTRATMWMSLKNMLSDRSQTQKATYHMIPFT